MSSKILDLCPLKKPSKIIAKKEHFQARIFSFLVHQARSRFWDTRFWYTRMLIISSKICFIKRFILYTIGWYICIISDFSLWFGQIVYQKINWVWLKFGHNRPSKPLVCASISKMIFRKSDYLDVLIIKIKTRQDWLNSLSCNSSIQAPSKNEARIWPFNISSRSRISSKSCSTLIYALSSFSFRSLIFTQEDDFKGNSYFDSTRMNVLKKKI